MVSSISIKWKSFSSKFIQHIDGALTDITIPLQSGPKSNVCDRGIQHFPDLQNRSLTTRYSLVSF